MNSEITTGAEYGGSRRRANRRRKKRGLPLLRLFLLLCLICGALAYREFGNRFSKRYAAVEDGTALLKSTNPSSVLSPFAADLAVPEADSGSEYLTDVRAEGVLLIDGTNRKSLLSRNAYTRMNPASTTKIMTCLLALEDTEIHMDDLWTAGPEIVVSEPGASMGGFQQGDQLTAEQVLYCLMVRSGADAANMVATRVAGSEEAFVERMNRRAKELGATGTHFTNSHGLTDPNHYTTPYDLYLILHEAMKYPEFRKLASEKLYVADYVDASGQAVQKKWFSTNYYLVGKAKLPTGFSVVAAKTGTTLAAGACLAQLSASESGREYYSIVLKSPNHDTLYQDTSLLLQKSAQVH